MFKGPESIESFDKDGRRGPQLGQLVQRDSEDADIVGSRARQRFNALSVQESDDGCADVPARDGTQEPDLSSGEKIFEDASDARSG
jgi:hypothetical protein